MNPSASFMTNLAKKDSSQVLTRSKCVRIDSGMVPAVQRLVNEGVALLLRPAPDLKISSVISLVLLAEVANRSQSLPRRKTLNTFSTLVSWTPYAERARQSPSSVRAPAQPVMVLEGAKDDGVASVQNVGDKGRFALVLALWRSFVPVPAVEVRAD